MELIMAALMVYYSRKLFKVHPLSIIRLVLSIFLVLHVGTHLSILSIPTVASKCRPLITSKNLYTQAILVAVMAMAFGLWSMVTIRKM
jgi:hypothetical protein